LYGSERRISARRHPPPFLSCLYGSELRPVVARLQRNFLSCLYGSEQKSDLSCSARTFLSCLYGSELKYYTFSPLLIKQNHLIFLLQPFFILTFQQR
ncbi:hypothetical protein, partial [Escherichia sp. E2748]|uniref:hypothetical protein n=1 Tax=Escherichia sp. E2748 TaxID=2044460 RepID=UPI0011019639